MSDKKETVVYEVKSESALKNAIGAGILVGIVVLAGGVYMLATKRDNRFSKGVSGSVVDATTGDTLSKERYSEVMEGQIGAMPDGMRATARKSMEAEAASAFKVESQQPEQAYIPAAIVPPLSVERPKIRARYSIPKSVQSKRDGIANEIRRHEYMIERGEEYISKHGDSGYKIGSAIEKHDSEKRKLQLMLGDVS